MTLEERLARFSEDAINLAAKKRELELAEYEKTLAGMYSSQTRTLRRQSAARLRLSRDESIRERNRLLSKEHLEAKRRLSATEKELKDQLFDRVCQMLEKYRLTENYKNDLLGLIASAKQQAGTDNICVFVDVRDEALIAELAAKTGLQISTTQEPILGGILAMPIGERLLVDLGYDSALQNEYDNLVIGGDAYGE